MAAFDSALALGASADGHIVVIHDEMLDQITNGSGPVAEHTLTHRRREPPEGQT